MQTEKINLLKTYLSLYIDHFTVLENLKKRRFTLCDIRCS